MVVAVSMVGSGWSAPAESRWSACGAGLSVSDTDVGFGGRANVVSLEATPTRPLPLRPCGNHGALAGMPAVAVHAIRAGVDAVALASSGAVTPAGSGTTSASSTLSRGATAIGAVSCAGSGCQTASVVSSALPARTGSGSAAATRTTTAAVWRARAGVVPGFASLRAAGAWLAGPGRLLGPGTVVATAGPASGGAVSLAGAGALTAPDTWTRLVTASPAGSRPVSVIGQGRTFAAVSLAGAVSASWTRSWLCGHSDPAVPAGTGAVTATADVTAVSAVVFRAGMTLAGTGGLGAGGISDAGLVRLAGAGAALAVPRTGGSGFALLVHAAVGDQPDGVVGDTPSDERGWIGTGGLHLSSRTSVSASACS